MTIYIAAGNKAGLVAEIKAVEDAWLLSEQPIDGGELDDNEVSDTGLIVGMTND